MRQFPSLGAQMSISGGIDQAFSRGKLVGCDTIQIFTKNSRQWRTKKFDKNEITAFFRQQEKTGIFPVIAHAGYLINLGSTHEESKSKSIESLIEEIENASILKIPYLVLHPGSHLNTGEEEGIERISSALNYVLSKTGKSCVQLLLETTSGQGTNLGYKFEQLAEIVRLIEFKNRIGICMDTCHIFSAGYDIRGKDSYDQIINEFDRVIGLRLLKVIHLNDSKTELGSRKDRHEHIGKGMIGTSGFRNVLNDTRLKKIPMIIETPGQDRMFNDKRNLKVLRSLIVA